MTSEKMDEIPKTTDLNKADPIMLEDGSYKTMEDEELDTELMNRILNPTFIECLKTVSNLPFLICNIFIFFIFHVYCFLLCI